MAGLERYSPARFRSSAPGRLRHAAGEALPRHCHREAFAAVVLAGGYDEAGDTGRHRVGAGDVIFHKAFESHLDLFHRPGAEVLVIPLPSGWHGPTLGTFPDPDALVRFGEKDAVETAELLVSGVGVRRPELLDWPDVLAHALRTDQSLNLARWAEQKGLHPGSLGRGFARVFGTTPAAYRVTQRARRAVELLMGTGLSLSEIAIDCGFSDQSHMTRSVSCLTGASPMGLRYSSRGQLEDSLHRASDYPRREANL